MVKPWATMFDHALAKLSSTVVKLAKSLTTMLWQSLLTMVNHYAIIVDHG
jgi:hypothetical protein